MNKIILALDTTNLEEAISITKKVKNKIFSVKVGLELFNFFGKEGIKKFNEMGITNLMLDLKLKDIPQTVYKAIKALDDIKFGYITIHGQGGKEMIAKAKKAASDAANISNLSPKTTIISGSKSANASAKPIIPNPVDLEMAVEVSAESNISTLRSILKPSFSISL